MTILGNPDVFVQWERIEEPGENPMWTSQCGRIEQVNFGNSPLFQGYVGNLPVAQKITLSTAKSEVETRFKKYGKLKWNYHED